MKKIITTAKGAKIDINAMLHSMGDNVAVGNAGLNARGDKIGKNGEIVKTYDQITTEYYQNNPKAVTKAPVSLKDISSEIAITPKEAIEQLSKAKSKRKIVDTDI